MSRELGAARLTFIHLSDIHFRKGVSGTLFDIDTPLRDAIETDIEQQLETLRSRADAILITGDIAYGGKEEEYREAVAWLRKLCDKARTDMEFVFCVPGNHDVDRDIVKSSVTIRDAQHVIRGQAPNEIDRALNERLKDPASGEALFLPMRAYNRSFAWGLSCACSPATPYWEQKFTLNDGSTLCLRGLTSTLLSAQDNEQHTLFLGRVQTTLTSRHKKFLQQIAQLVKVGEMPRPDKRIVTLLKKIEAL